jgi:2-polyprenyl-6-methoxyphenol hydroxylase-like FAD-dependent oxidoreductase
MTDLIGGEAIVVGAGMAGLTAAKAISGHFEHITVFERDNFQEAPAPRVGVPQSRHPHALLGGGLSALEDLFPNFEESLRIAGAVPFRVGLDTRIERKGFDPFPMRDLGWDGLSLSRPLIEFVTRRHVEKEANILFRPGCRVTEITAAPDQKSIKGVRFESGPGPIETLEADLVLDASGRGSLTLQFLDRYLGQHPQQTEIGSDQGYSTAIFERPGDFQRDWKLFLHLPSAPESCRAATITDIEGGRWMIGLGGMHADFPPGDTAGYLEFAKSLRTPTAYEAIRSTRQIGGIERFRFPASIRRHFEKIAAFPRGLVAIGDAVCRFNPVFGQGMTVAAQEAVCLRRLLNERSKSADPFDGLSSAFFELIKSFIATPWAVAESDFIYPETRGARPESFEQRMKYNRALVKLAAEDPFVHKLFVEVNHLMKPGDVLRDPAISGRVREILEASPA